MIDIVNNISIKNLNFYKHKCYGNFLEFYIYKCNARNTLFFIYGGPYQYCENYE